MALSSASVMLFATLILGGIFVLSRLKMVKMRKADVPVSGSRGKPVLISAESGGLCTIESVTILPSNRVKLTLATQDGRLVISKFKSEVIELDPDQIKFGNGRPIYITSETVDRMLRSFQVNAKLANTINSVAQTNPESINLGVLKTIEQMKDTAEKLKIESNDNKRKADMLQTNISDEVTRNLTFAQMLAKGTTYNTQK